MKSAIRVGQGFDVHVFAEGRPLILGGVTIPFERGLLGYSDADVLLHAVTDALLGAAGQGDIGRLFPDTDSRYKGADSRALLRRVAARVWEAGWEVGNVDATVICEDPKIQPYAARMAANIADALNIEESAVNIKGKTTEKLGFTGRGEGIAAQAVALLLRRPA
jgi:2-C-methyl-D-erythritol 2,4-cyclodiphosphate synthase